MKPLLYRDLPKVLQHFAAGYGKALYFFLSVHARRMWLGALRAGGRQGVVAASLLLLCPVFYFAAIVPAQERLAVARHKAILMQGQGGALRDAIRRQPDSPAHQLEAFYKQFPSARGLPDALETLVAIAEHHGISISEGDYKVTHEKLGKLMRFHMTLPLKGEYPQIRKFLAALPAGLPTIALENIQFERQKVADPLVEVKVRLVVFLERT
jgi:Tfp pilus assembly protein PilO